MQELLDKVEAKPGDFILFSADKFDVVCRVLCGLRLTIGDMLGLRKKDDFKFLIVTDFPQFEWSEEQGRFLAMHHPFTMPYEEDIQYLFSDPARVRAQAYDVVLNGIELGSGSIRIHRQDIQQKMFEALGMTDEEIQAKFGFLVDAYRYGAPPHGGMGIGLDRLAMIMCKADSLRDVTAFPKVQNASELMSECPSAVDDESLSVLGIKVDIKED